MSERQAIHIACDLYHRPLMARAVQTGPLPPGMLDVIKIAAGELPNRDGKLLPGALTPEQMRQAAVFFLQQALFQAKGDDFRLLGLGPDARREQVRDHKRWLLKWLHPDRNPSRWESQLFLKVSQAAERLDKALVERPVAAAADAGPEPKPAAADVIAKPVKRPSIPPSAGLRRQRHHHGVPSVIASRVPLTQERRSKRWLRRSAVAALVAGLGLVSWSYVEGRPLGVMVHDLAQRPVAWLSAALQ